MPWRSLERRTEEAPTGRFGGIAKGTLPEGSATVALELAARAAAPIRHLHSVSGGSRSASVTNPDGGIRVRTTTFSLDLEPPAPFDGNPFMVTPRAFLQSTSIAGETSSSKNAGVDHAFSAFRDLDGRESVDTTATKKLPRAHRFHIDLTVDWSDEHWYQQSEVVSMQYSNYAIEEEYTRWLIATARRSGYLPITLHGAFTIWMALMVALIATNDTEYIVIFGAQLFAALFSLAEMTVNSDWWRRRRCGFAATESGSSTQELDMPQRRASGNSGVTAAVPDNTSVKSDSDGVQGSCSNRRELLAFTVYGLCNTLSIFLAHGTVQTSPLASFVSEYTQVGEYALQVIPIYLLIATALIYDFRFSFGAMLAVAYFAASACGTRFLGTQPQQLVISLILTELGIIICVICFMRMHERTLRDRFEYVVRVQLGLVKARQQEKAMWAIVKGIVPEPLWTRVRNATSWRSLGFLDHATLGVVSVAALPGFRLWTRNLSPVEVVSVVFRVFSSFDTMLLERKASSFGVTRVFVTGDMYFMCGGVIGEGRGGPLSVQKPGVFPTFHRKSSSGAKCVKRSPRGAQPPKSPLSVTTPVRSLTDNNNGSSGNVGLKGLLAHPPKSKRGRRDAIEHSMAVLSRVTSYGFEQVQSSRGHVASAEAFGVTVGIGYGDCWGGLNGGMLHHRYMILGDALEMALKAARAGAPREVLLHEKAVIALFSPENDSVIAQNITRRYKPAPTTAADVRKLVLLTADDRDNAANFVPGATVSPVTPHIIHGATRIGNEATQYSTDSGEGVKSPLAAVESPLLAFATQPELEDDDDVPPPPPRRALSANALHSDADEDQPVQSRMLLVDVPRLTTEERLTEVDRAASESVHASVVKFTEVDKKGRFAFAKSEAAYNEFCHDQDLKHSAIVCFGHIVLLAVLLIAFLVDRTVHQGVLHGDPFARRPSDFTAAFSFTLGIACCLLEYLILPCLMRGKHTWWSSILALATPSFMSAGIAASVGSFVGNSMHVCFALNSMLVLMRSRSQHHALKTLQYAVLSVGPFVVVLAHVQPNLAALADEWTFIIYVIVSVVIVFVVARRSTLAHRRLFASAVLSTELLEASQRRVNVREGLLNGLLPRHLVPSVVKCIQAAEHDAELLRVQSELLAGPLRDSRALGSAQRGHDDNNEGLQSVGAARSIFDGEPRFIEIWDNLVVVAVRFSLPIPMALDDDDVTIGTTVRSRRETDETHRSLHDTIESLRAIDVCLHMLAMRVIRVVGDTVMIAAIPAKSNAPDTPPLPFASDVPSEPESSSVVEEEEKPWCPATTAVCFVRRLVRRTPVPFSAAISAGVGFGTVFGSTMQHLVMGDAVRFLDAMIDACPTVPAESPVRPMMHLAAAEGSGTAESQRSSTSRTSRHADRCDAYVTASFKKMFSAEVAEGATRTMPDGGDVFAATPARWRVREWGTVVVFRLPLSSTTDIAGASGASSTALPSMARSRPANGETNSVISDSSRRFSSDRPIVVAIPPMGGGVQRQRSGGDSSPVVAQQQQQPSYHDQWSPAEDDLEEAMSSFEQDHQASFDAIEEGNFDGEGPDAPYHVEDEGIDGA
jgi:hypothetical protein